MLREMYGLPVDPTAGRLRCAETLYAVDKTNVEDAEFNGCFRNVERGFYISPAVQRSYIYDLSLWLYHNCDSTTIRLRRKIDMFIFLLAWNWEQARAIRRSRIIVVL